MNTPDPNFYGITVPQILAFFLTVIASYFSARWGSAESRKQFTKKTEDDERAAAAELIPLLMKFALDCERKKHNLSLYISSNSQDGQDETISGVDFSSAIHSAAARLGPHITERAIKLEMMKIRAEEYVSGAAGYVDESDLDDSVLSFLALLSLKARHLADSAAGKVGIAMRHPQEELDQLLKEAMKHSSEIDSGDENSWH